MSAVGDAPGPRDLPATPTVERVIHGPRAQPGFVLRAAPLEALVWDLESEVASSARVRVAEGRWWFAAGYLDSVVEIVLRSFPSVLLLERDGEDRLLSRDGVAAVQGRLL